MPPRLNVFNRRKHITQIQIPNGTTGQKDGDAAIAKEAAQQVVLNETLRDQCREAIEKHNFNKIEVATVQETAGCVIKSLEKELIEQSKQHEANVKQMQAEHASRLCEKQNLLDAACNDNNQLKMKINKAQSILSGVYDA